MFLRAGAWRVTGEGICFFAFFGALFGLAVSAGWWAVSTFGIVSPPAQDQIIACGVLGTIVGGIGLPVLLQFSIR
jgi:hypothetical protein